MSAAAAWRRPCDSCTLATPGPADCCRDWSVPVEVHEAAAFVEVLVPLPGSRYAGELLRRPTGECVFLGPAGCGIYERRPQACRTFGQACGIGRLDVVEARRPTRAVMSDRQDARADAVEVAIDPGAALHESRPRADLRGRGTSPPASLDHVSQEERGRSDHDRDEQALPRHRPEAAVGYGNGASVTKAASPVDPCTS